MEKIAEKLTLTDGVMTVQGSCDSAYAPVLETFIANFRERRELGASVAGYKDGKKVFDIWGGHMDEARTRPWAEHSIVSMASVVKGMMALGIHMLADQGKISYDAPVADYWPEFAQNGKDKVTVRQAISHHAAIHFIDHARPGDAYRWDKMVDAIAKQKPEWEPGTRGVYHTISITPILGKLIYCVTGELPWDWFRREVTEKLGIEYNLHLTDTDFAHYGPDFETAHFIQGANMSVEVMRRFFGGMWDTQKGSFADPREVLSPEELAEVPYHTSAGNARGVARLFAFCAENGELDGTRILSPRTIDLMTEVQWYENCAIWGTPMRTALGLLRSDPKFFYAGPNPNAFGTAGAGGSFGFADRDNRFAMAYSVNRWWPALSLGDRARSLIDTAYTVL